MSPHVSKLLSKLVPHTVSHRWNLYKIVSGFTALILVLALLPLPKDLPQGGANHIPSFNYAYTIDDIGDGFDANGGSDTTCDDGSGNCTLRAALDTVNVQGGPAVIGFDATLFATKQTISLINGPLVITTDGITIDGVITPAGDINVVLDGSGLDDDEAHCTNSDGPDSTLSPILRITSANNVIWGLAFTNAPGNAIEIINPTSDPTATNSNLIENNWIGFSDRLTTPTSLTTGSGSGLHGICVFAEDEDINFTEISGNIIAANGNDGIRLEGFYEGIIGIERYVVNGTLIEGNLIGNIYGTDGNDFGDGYLPGNAYSGITARISDNAFIHRNVITNNGFAFGELNVSDGITLLEANNNYISENYIGTAQQEFGLRGLGTDFPLPVDAQNLLDIASTHPGELNNYIPDLDNACDGIAIRYFDHLDPFYVTNEPVEVYVCPDPDFNLDNEHSVPIDGPEDFVTKYKADDIGPSVHNHIWNNDIGYNKRNGIYIQSLACLFLSNNPPLSYQNLPNVYTGTGGSLYYVQSAQNTILQNTIFRNDDSDFNGDLPVPVPTTDPKSDPEHYGIGIDLEDYATAAFFDPEVAGDNYWALNFSVPEGGPCPMDVDMSDIRPVQPPSVEVDYNITENDDYFTPAFPVIDFDPGFDPDAGANRLTNFPVIDEANSTPTSIKGIAPEGTLVEVFQVVCTSGESSDICPFTGSGILSNGDVDFWNNQNGIPKDDIHERGHGQGFRFLGNAYVPGDPTDLDADHFGAFDINPQDFVDGSFHDVGTFNGGLITATATAFLDKLCWDSGDAEPAPCDDQEDPVSIAPASAEVSAQRAGTSGSGGLWVPYEISNCGTNVIVLPPDPNAPPPPPPPPAVYNDLTTGSLLSCLGSTSEFSANALITGTGAFIMTKTSDPLPGSTVNPTDVVTYTITLTNTGSTTIHVDAGALNDVYPTGSLTVVSCDWVTPNAGAQVCTPPLSPNPTTNTDYGTLDPGETLTITIKGTVNEGLTGLDCIFGNTVNSNNTQITDVYGPVDGTKTASTGPLFVDCGQTGSGSTFEKQVQVNSGLFLDGDTLGVDTPEADRGDDVTYSFHYGNTTGAGTFVNVTDIFPLVLAGSPTSVTCWFNGTPVDNDPSDDPLIVHFQDCDYDTTYQGFDADNTTPFPAIDSFSIPDGAYLHILVSGHSVLTNYPVPGNPICNIANVFVDDESNVPIDFITDHACIEILDPAMIINKSVSVNGAPETSANPGPVVPAGGAVTYFLDVINSGDGVMTGLVMSDVFPAALGPAGWTCSFDVLGSGTLTDHSGPYAGVCAVNTITGEIDGGFFPSPLTLDPGEVVHVRLTGKTIPLDANGVLCNNMFAKPDLLPQATDEACVNLTQVPPPPALQVYKSVTVNGAPETSVDAPGPGPNVPAGGAVTYFIDVANNSLATLSDIHLTDTFPAGLNVPPAWVCEYGFANDALTNHALLTYTFGDCTVDASGVINGGLPPPGLLSLDPGQVLHIRLSAKNIPLSASGVLCNRIDVTAEASTFIGTDSACVNVSTTPPDGGNGQVDFDKEATNDSGGSEDPDVFELGDTVKYQVTIRNTSGSNVSNLTLKDPIPEEEEDLRNVVATSGAVNNSELSADRLEVTGISVGVGSSVTVDYDVSILDDNDFPLDNYDLDPDADHEDEDFYPVDVEDDDIGTNSDNDDPEDALDAPDGHYVSLGEDGEITVRTSDEDDEQGKLIVDGNGDDFCVVEVDPSVDTDGTTEEYEVEVSQTSDNSDFESVGSSTNNSDCFDLEDADMTWARFVRIVETSSSVKGSAPGSDIDAVCLLNLGGFVTNTATLLSGSTSLGNRSDTVLVDFTDAFDDPLSESDCQPTKETRTPAPTPTPPGSYPPTPLPPLPPMPPFVRLPTTGPEAQGLPLILTGLMGMIGWVAKRKKF